jgi:aminoglycoside phosphotransferase (APT) family kinase protein
VDFRRQSPSPDAVRWVERALGRGFRVVAARRMTGGITSTVHRLTVEGDGDRRLFFVLRQYEPFEPWLDPARLTVPATARRPDVWRAAIEVLRSPREQRSACFIHRDFQHFNLLWARGRLTGVVDWSVASSFAPPEIDVGHCRLNLAVLFCADWAERFRLAYEAETGRSTDPWWDLHALASYNDAWRQYR